MQSMSKKAKLFWKGTERNQKLRFFGTETEQKRTPNFKK